MYVEKSEGQMHEKGRFPANVILTYEQITFDEVCGGMPYTHPAGNKNESNITKGNSMFGIGSCGKRNPKIPGDEGDSASRYFKNCQYTRKDEDICRYFYSGKASKKDRDEGLDMFEEKTSGELTARKENSAGITAYVGSRVPKKNMHPTVKPTLLMQYLVRLVSPKGATILDPFMGSGSTGKAIMYENKERNAGYSFIGIEKEKEYCDIAKARIEYAMKQ